MNHLKSLRGHISHIKMVMLASQFPPAQKSKWPMRLTLSSLVIFQVILWTVLSPIIPVVTAIKLEPDGGYTGLVFKIHKDVPEDMCEDIIKQMKVRTIILISFL